MKKNVTIVGAGLVGSLLSLYMTKRGYSVNIFERRKDLRSEVITSGKSINLALSERGWSSLRRVGVDDEVKKIAIPMYKRIMHDVDGNLTEQPYGKPDQAIYSVSRVQLNILLMKLAEERGAKLHFNEKCTDANLEEGKAVFQNTSDNIFKTVSSDLLIGADGAFSAIRKKMISQFSHKYEYNEIDHDYKELLIPAGDDGEYLLDKNALHIWPRGEFMVIALANLDGSFTCTLFAPKKGKNSFESLNTKSDVEEYFNTLFPDFASLVPDLYSQWSSNPTSTLAIIRTFPWHLGGSSILIGDSAHATVPFYGQGMNAGFEDCRVFDDLLNEYDDMHECLENYTKKRKPDGDGLQDLSLHNFIVMRDKTADPKFLLQKKIEARFSKLYPKKWIPLYSMVSFTNIPYSQAWQIGIKQENIMQKVMQSKNIKKEWKSDKIMQKILSLL